MVADADAGHGEAVVGEEADPATAARADEQPLVPCPKLPSIWSSVVRTA
jgi:hypothetical protein